MISSHRQMSFWFLIDFPPIWSNKVKKDLLIKVTKPQFKRRIQEKMKKVSFCAWTIYGEKVNEVRLGRVSSHSDRMFASQLVNGISEQATWCIRVHEGSQGPFTQDRDRGSQTDLSWRRRSEFRFQVWAYKQWREDMRKDYGASVRKCIRIIAWE